jgi:hypothetical protein
MKREILCKSCSLKLPAGVDIQSISSLREYFFDSQFRVKRKYGTSTRHVMYDKCGGQIEKGEECSCVSTFDKNEYFEWERDYIE